MFILNYIFTVKVLSINKKAAFVVVGIKLNKLIRILALDVLLLLLAVLHLLLLDTRPRPLVRLGLKTLHLLSVLAGK